jgi:hypothetical protein
MSRHRAKTTITEKGQVLVMAALVMLVLVAAIGLAIDLGRIFTARAQLVRAVDAAALAGTLELPNLTTAEAKVRAYMTENEPSAHVDVPISPADRQIEVNGSKQVPMFFIKILGIDSVEVTAHATAGFGILAVDTVMAIDATGSMAGSQITDAKNAAISFTNTLLTGSVASTDTVVGETPYRGCFNAPNPFTACVPIATMVQPLSNDKSVITAKINQVTAVGGTGTNICNGMYEANQILFGAGHHTVSNALHIVVILSDGDNTYNAIANGLPTPNPNPPSHPPPTSTPNPARQLPSVCRPTSPYTSDAYTGTDCHSAGTQQIKLDIKTKQLADTLINSGVEIYVVGFVPCGSGPNGDPHPEQVKTTSFCNNVGNGDTDTIANRRLLKCIASSTAGTNDHYFEVTSSSQLPSIFTNIARLIGFRLIK